MQPYEGDLIQVKKNQMKKIGLLLVLFTLLFQNCNHDDCGACFTPAQSFSFEILDKLSGENLFTNGTYDAVNIKITDNLIIMNPLGLNSLQKIILTSLILVPLVGKQKL